jgi:hypothetical protein
MSRSDPKSFTAVLEPAGTRLRWVIARIPFDVTKVWPERRGLRVRGEIACLNGKNKTSKSERAGFAFRTALFPDPHGEGKVLVVNRKMQAGAKAGVGRRVRIWLDRLRKNSECKCSFCVTVSPQRIGL